MPNLLYGAGVFGVLAIASIIAVFGYDPSEVAGTKTSFLMSATFSAVTAGVATAGFIGRGELRGLRPGSKVSFALGVGGGALLSSLAGSLYQTLVSFCWELPPF